MQLSRQTLFKFIITSSVAFQPLFAQAGLFGLGRHKPQTEQQPDMPVALPFQAPVTGIPSLAPGSGPSTVTITPDTLRQLFMQRNLSIWTEFNMVEQAKQQVNKSRDALFPQLSLNVAVGTNPVSFLLSGIDMLLPFLLPSNWANLHASDNNLKAEGEAYYLVELNGFASAYSLISTIANDQTLETIYAQQWSDYKKIQQVVQQRESIGFANKGDYDQAAAQAHLSARQMSQVRETLAQETESLRQMLALPLGTKFVFKGFTVAKSSSEGQTPTTLINTVIAKSPELRQIQDQIAAGKNGVTAAQWSFLTTPSLGSGGSASSGGASFSSLTPSFGVTLSLGYFPTVSLAKLNVQQLQEREEEIQAQLDETLASNLRAVTESEEQYSQSSSAESELKEAYTIEMQKYSVGASDIQNLLIVRQNETVASVARLQAKIDMYNLRINLHRILLTDQFSNIHDCVLSPVRSDKKLSLDQLCQQQAQRTP